MRPPTWRALDVTTLGLTEDGMTTPCLRRPRLAVLVRSHMYRVSPFDPVTFVLVPAVLATVALVACWLPARRATRGVPVRALRNE